MFSGYGFDLNNEEENEVVHQLPPESPQEPLFEKPLTPSDVGKLNRLVIPKQHAEKYFPVYGSEKGLLLGFEDELGKPWRFRYSYWSSSQSYVLTKGWSRFVKEKRLDAGDVVRFARHKADVGRLFIGWRRRISRGGGGGWSRQVLAANSYPGDASSCPYQTDCRHAGGSLPQIQPTLTPGIPRQVRLFGVNLVWQAKDKESLQSDGYEIQRR